MPKKHNLNDEEVADLKEAFSMFDIDGDGKFLIGRVRPRCRVSSLRAERGCWCNKAVTCAMGGAGAAR
jgi:hypothetical protein